MYFSHYREKRQQEKQAREDVERLVRELEDKVKSLLRKGNKNISA